MLRAVCEEVVGGAGVALALLVGEGFGGREHAAEELGAGDWDKLVVLHEADSELRLMELHVKFVTVGGK